MTLAGALVAAAGVRRPDMPTKKKRSTTKRETLESKNATFFAKRAAKGRFKEMDERGRAQAADRRKTAKRSVRGGHADQGDRKKRAA